MSAGDGTKCVESHSDRDRNTAAQKRIGLQQTETIQTMHDQTLWKLIESLTDAAVDDRSDYRFTKCRDYLQSTTTAFSDIEPNQKTEISASRRPVKVHRE